jgi:hypothetical protein
VIRTLTGSLVGGGIGFMAGAVVILALSVETGSSGDVVPACVFVGILLAGPLAIAGAVVGGVADLLAYYRRMDRQAFWKSQPKIG